MSKDEPSPRDALWRMTNAYQAIHVAATLSIADLLKDGPKSADELAEATSADVATLYRLLRALASVGVFAEASDGRCGMTPLAGYHRSDAPGSVPTCPVQIGQPYHWSAWAHLLDSVKS